MASWCWGAREQGKRENGAVAGRDGAVEPVEPRARAAPGRGQ